MSLLNPVLSPPDVKAYLSQGERFIKWDDETSIASPVILRVDPKGYYLYWTYQSKEMEFLDITSIRDTRFGKFAKMPKSQKLREVFNMDFPDNHFLMKALTVVSGPDMVDLTFHNFVSYKENVGKVHWQHLGRVLGQPDLPARVVGLGRGARTLVTRSVTSRLCVLQDWAEDILALAKHPMTANAPRSTFLDKILVKLKMQLNPEGKIPVKNFFQMFPADRKRVEAALSACHLAKGKNDAINPEDFPESVYKSFLMSLCPRPEIDEIFTSYHAKAKPYMTKEHLTKFINQKQRDCRLNSLLFPPARPEQVQALIDKYEPSGINVQRGQLSPEGMVWFLCGPENSVLAHNALLLHHDMTQPLNHYFINSSHNTYLTAGQFSGLSSAEMYRQVLLSGCRCVELDCWKGKPPEEEPIITHGFTMTTDILFKEAIEAIAESAFKTSPYPVILSFENHVDSPRQQAKMAEYCRTMFGDTLLTDPLEKFPLKPGIPLPSPEDLRGKILIKNKKNQFSGPTSPTCPGGQKPGGEAEGSCSSSVPTEDDTEKNRSYVISSFTELKANELLSKASMQFVEQERLESIEKRLGMIQAPPSSLHPLIPPDLPMQQNMALFEFNGQSGYLLKHEFMRSLDKQFNPFSVDRIDVVVISGQFLSERSVRTYVEVELFGLPGDPKRRYRTKLSPTTNSINPVWKEEPFVFEKPVSPVEQEKVGRWILPAQLHTYQAGHALCFPDLTVALANPIKYFNAHDKKSVKLKEVTGSLPEAVLTQKPFQSGIPVASQSNGASVSAGSGLTEPQTASLEELRELKGVVKLQRRQEKELRELERRGAKRWEELLQHGTEQLAELRAQAAGCKLRPGKGSRKKRTCEETVVVAPSELPEGADPRVRELKDWLEQELQQHGEEQYHSVLKRKEQHVAEQIAKMMELARERQAAELKTFKETSETDTKEMKKKLEAKRLERIQAMTKITTDKMTETREQHQERLEGKQTACLEQIRELEKQFQKKALDEYEARMKGLETEVKESVRACFKACFPSETEDKPQRACEASKELCPQEPPMDKADTQESRL
ncbi:hypothetical protein NN561_009514 [Cricetulus griseus]